MEVRINIHAKTSKSYRLSIFTHHFVALGWVGAENFAEVERVICLIQK